MEAKQFLVRKLSPLTTRIFAIKWSDDNRLSIVTSKGVQILEIVPASGKINPILNLHRTIIQSPGTFPCERYAETLIPKMIENWDKDDIYSFMMIDAYTPSFPKATRPVSEVYDIYWSPRDLFHPNRCLIALLTTGGGVDIAVQIDHNWFTICSVNEEWADIIEIDFQAIKIANEINPKTMKNHMDRLVTTSVAWSCIYKTNQNECYAYLVMAHRNSEITIWKIDRVNSYTISENFCTKPELKFNKKLIEPNVKISSLLWINLNEKHCLLVVGYYNGPVGVVKFQKQDDQLEFDLYSTCFSDEDSIAVDSLHVLRETAKWLELVIIKGMHLLTLVIDNQGKMISMKFVTSPGFSITGASIINSDIILITTQDGQLCEVKKSYDQQELICKPLKIDVPKIPLQYLGLTSSPNHVIFTLLATPSVMYDHLCNREPTTIYFFNLNNVPMYNPMTILNAEEQSLINCWDCLELVKINAVKYNELFFNLNELYENLESMSLHELRVSYWTMTTLDSNAQKKSNLIEIPSTMNINDKIEQSHSYIFLHSACDYLALLSERKILTDLQKLSASILRTHLEIWLAGEEMKEEEEGIDESPLTARVRHTLEIIEVPTETEKCNYCNKIVLEPWSQECPDGHLLTRCAITCLQVSCSRYRSCIVCQEIFHPSLDVENVISEVRCPYCDLPAFFKNETIDETIRTSRKNLSIKPMLDNKNTKNEDNDDDLAGEN